MAELATQAEWYSPFVDDSGEYIDKYPHANALQFGIRCPCIPRTTHTPKVYKNRQSFIVHCRTASHQRWLSQMNSNKQNFYVELEQCKQDVANQRLIIAEQQKTLDEKNTIIHFLTKKVMEQEVKLNSVRTDELSVDLLGIDET